MQSYSTYKIYSIIFSQKELQEIYNLARILIVEYNIYKSDFLM